MGDFRNMAKNPDKTAQRFLEGLNSTPTKDTVSLLIRLVEELETKHDPEPTEIRLVQNIYSFVEKMKILENNLRSYVKESRNLPGNKLASLYEDISYDGNSIWRD